LASPRPDALSPSPSPGWAHNTRRYTHLLAGGPGPSGRVYAVIVPVVITGSGITAKWGEVRILGFLGGSASVGVGRQTVVAVGGDAVVFLARLLYRIDVDDGSVQVAQVVQ